MRNPSGVPWIASTQRMGAGRCPADGLLLGGSQGTASGGPLIVNVIVEVTKALAKAVVTGVGLELARVASQRVRRRLGVKDDDEHKIESDLERVKRENAELRRELEAIKAERNERNPKPERASEPSST